MRNKSTVLKFVNQALYDEKNGYYFKGKVDFDKDFNTFGMIYGPLFANRFFLMWKSMREFEGMSKEENFYVYEFGAGDGRTAERILDYIYGRSLAEPESEWPYFYNALNYVIGEISPALVEKQKNRIQYYITEKKAQIFQSDATKLDSQLPKGKGVVFSNELIDAFPFHEIHLENGSPKMILLTEENGKWEKEEHSISHMEAGEQQFLRKILAAAAPLFSESRIKILFHPGIENYYQKIMQFLEKGFILTVDYGFDGLWNFSQAKYSIVRTYSSEYTGNKDFDPNTLLSGEEDITSDICFSDLVLAGGESSFYGKQDNLGGHLADPFHMLIQGSNIHPKCKSHAMNDLKRPSPVNYSDMPRLFEIRNQGSLYFKKLKKYHDALRTGVMDSSDEEKLERNAEKFRDAFFIFLEWLHKTGYTENDRSYLGVLNEDFCFLLLECTLSILNLRNDESLTSMHASFLLDVFCDLVEQTAGAKILLTAISGSIASYYYEVEAEDNEEPKNKIIKALRFLEHLCRRYHPELTEKTLSTLDVSDYNIPSPFNRKTLGQSLLDRCLKHAENAKKSKKLNPVEVEASLFHHIDKARTPIFTFRPCSIM